MRIVWGIVFGFTAVLLAVVFAIVALTKIGSDYWFDYLAIVAFGVGAWGSARAARARLVPGARLPVRVEARVALAGAAVVLAGLALRTAVFALTRRQAHSGAVRSIEVVFGVVEVLGAAGCAGAARSRSSRGLGSPVASEHG